MADGNKQLAPLRNACPIAAVLHAGDHTLLPCHGRLEGDDVALGLLASGLCAHLRSLSDALERSRLPARRTSPRGRCPSAGGWLARARGGTRLPRHAVCRGTGGAARTLAGGSLTGGRASLSSAIAAEVAGRGGGAGAALVGLARCTIAIRNTAAVGCVVTPRVRARGGGAAGTDVGGVDGVVAVGIDVDVAVASIAVVAPRQRRDGGHADAERQAPGQRRSEMVARIIGGIRRILGRRIRRIRPASVDDGRVVRRDVDDLGLRRLYDDRLLLRRRTRGRWLHLYLLLLRCLQRAGFLRFEAQALHGRHHVGLLREE